MMNSIYIRTHTFGLHEPAEILDRENASSINKIIELVCSMRYYIVTS